MRSVAALAICILTLATFGGFAEDAGNKMRTARPPKVIAGYLQCWDTRPRYLAAGELTHVFYAFAEPSEDGTVKLSGCCGDENANCSAHGPSNGTGGEFAELTALKSANPNLRVLISIGGWNGSKYFSSVAATPGTRQLFASSIMRQFFDRSGTVFDGVDIDWEYPVTGGLVGNHRGARDRENFTLLMTELHRRLADRSAISGRQYLLTMAASADPNMMRNVEWNRIVQVADWINLMSYDYYAGTRTAGFNAALFRAKGDPSPSSNIDASVTALRKSGVSVAKIVLGVPFYGRAYANVEAKNGGAFQSGDQSGATDWGGAEGVDYRDLITRQPEMNGFQRYWSEEAQVPWLYSARDRVWISYDDSESVFRKAEYARSHHLAGIMIWHLGSDDGTLLPAVHRGFGS